MLRKAAVFHVAIAATAIRGRYEDALEAGGVEDGRSVMTSETDHSIC
jgi:hypothetical protein